jgi:hypothetical protein
MEHIFEHHETSVKFAQKSRRIVLVKLCSASDQTLCFLFCICSNRVRFILKQWVKLFGMSGWIDRLSNIHDENNEKLFLKKYKHY